MSDRSGEVCERGIGVARNGDWDVGIGDLGDFVGEGDGRALEPLK